MTFFLLKNIYLKTILNYQRFEISISFKKRKENNKN